MSALLLLVKKKMAASSAQRQSPIAPEERARYRRRDHANLEAMINLAIAGVAEHAAVAYAAANPHEERPPDFTMPPDVRHLLSALIGAHGGGAVAFEEFTRDYLTIGEQLHYAGTETAIRARVRRRVDALLAWQGLVGFELVAVVKGGEIIGREADGTPIRKGSTFINNLVPISDDGVMRARASDQWRGNEALGIDAHPGLALVAQVPSVVKALPRSQSGATSGGQKTGSQPLDIYEADQERRVCASVEAVADKIEQRGGDADLWLNKLETRICRIRRSRHKTARARHDHEFIVPDETAAEGKGLGNEFVTQETQESPSAQEVADQPTCSITDLQSATMQEAALFWAEQGIPVFPLYGVADGICDCAEGSECKRAGKHPRTRHGKDEATTDERQIKLWWTRWPAANIAGRMGGELRLFAVDSDPRHGGDLSLHDLTDAHGPEWLDTFTNGTGGNGDHFLYHYPAGVGIRNSTGKLGPGLDVRSEGGYIVLPPSSHASGRHYRLKNPAPVREALPWLVEALTRASGEAPSMVVDFQERKTRASAGGVIPEGQRDCEVFRIGCGIWGHGAAADSPDLYQQLLSVHARCEVGVKPFTERDVWRITANITRRYERGVPMREGAA